MARYHGKNGRLYLSTSGGGTASPVASLSRWSLDMTVDTVDVSAFGDQNKQYVQGLYDAKGQISGFWDDTDSTLFLARNSAGALSAYVYPSLYAASKYAYGLAWISFSMEVAINAAVTITGNWTAGGTWGFTF